MPGTPDPSDTLMAKMPLVELTIDDKSKLRVSSYDRVSSALIIALIAVGSCVFLLFLVWLTRQIFISQEAVPVEFLEGLGDGEETAGGSIEDLTDPELDEMADFEPELDETLNTVAEIILIQAAALDAFPGESSSVGVRGGSHGASTETGGNANLIPRWQRWQIDFESADLATYAKQLDAFGIELAACGGGSEAIEYATKFRKPTPVKRQGSAKDEIRLYMTWRHGGLRRADMTLLARAGVKTTGKLIVQFYPSAVEQQLAAAEKQKAGSRAIEMIRQTVFGIKDGGGKYSFYVKEQQYR